MNFLYPEWFIALVFIPFLIVGAIMIRSNRSKIWQQFVAQKHRSSLVKNSRTKLHWVAFSLSLIGIIGMIVAIARPYHGKTTRRDKIKTRNIVIAVDTSLSMYCPDVSPNRLGVAKAAASNLIDAFPDDQIGIMAFAGSANPVTSISIDHISIKKAVSRLDQNSTHLRGSNLSAAVEKGIETLKKSGKQANALIIITDGTENLPDIEELAEKAKKAYVQIFTIGVGTRSGGTIPFNNQLHRDANGRVVTTKLEENALQQLAKATSGRYCNASANTKEIIATAINQMDQYEKQGRVRQVPKELYQWFLAPSILLLILSQLMRTHWKKVAPKSPPALPDEQSNKPNSSKLNSSKPTIPLKAANIVTIACAFFLLPEMVNAEESFMTHSSNQLFDKPAQIRNGYKALEKREYEKAIKHLEIAKDYSSGEQRASLSLALAQAYYRHGDFQKSTQAYSDALVSDDAAIQKSAQYNMGNAFFQSAAKRITAPPKEVPLEDYLEQSLKDDTIKKGTLRTMVRELNNSITQYSDTLSQDAQHPQASRNKASAEKFRDTIKKVLEKAEEERRKKEEEEEKQKKAKKKKGGEKKGEGSGEGEGEGEGEGKGKGKGKGKGQQGKQDGDQGEDDNKDEKAEKKESKPDKPSIEEQEKVAKNTEFKSKEDAIEYMKKHSDSKRKPTPVELGTFLKKNPKVDW